MKLLVVIHIKVSQNAIFPLKHVPIINVFKPSYLAGHARVSVRADLQSGRIEYLHL